jgi:hypothetical protein
MIRRTLLRAVAAAALLGQIACAEGSGAAAVPNRLPDDEFWRLSTALSEPAGEFTHSDNLVSNELHYVHMLRFLDRARGVYIGVGPEQNYSYIAKIRPEMAFIVDIRQENRDLHLLYKALFEVSVDRADFMSRLFSRERPAFAGRDTSVADLFRGYAAAAPSPALYGANLALIRERLLEAHHVPLADADLDWIEHAFRAFSANGPGIRYNRPQPPDPPPPTYAALMTAPDVNGQAQSYLASEEAFSFVKALHARNLIVPVVGDFSGQEAIRRVGEYVRARGAEVSVFYASNVEVYLTRAKRQAFCANLAALPHDARSWFVVSNALQPLAQKVTACR